MDTLQKRVGWVRRRLMVQRFVRALPWCWFAAGVLVVAAILIGKFSPVAIDAWVLGSTAAGGGLLAAAIAAWWTRPDELSAALEIDRRFGLKERVSTSLALSQEQRTSPIGAAQRADTLGRLQRLAVGERFRVEWPRWGWVPLVPALAAVLVAWLVPVVPPQQAQAAPQLAEQETIRKQAEALQRQLQQRRELAEQEGLEDAAELFDKLQRDLQRLTESTPQDRQQALVELNELGRQLDQRRNELRGNEALRQQLNQLKPNGQGPADKLADALRQGDLQRAVEEINKLREQLAKGDLNDEQREALAQQLDEMKQKLEQLAQAQQQAREQLEQQLAQARVAGDLAKASQLEEQLARLGNPMQNEALRKMAENLGQCAECARQADAAGAEQALQNLEAQLDEMRQQANELALLDEAQNQIGQCKGGMCQGGEQAGAQGGQQRGQHAGQQGRAMAPSTGVGRGHVPNAGGGEAGEGQFFDTRVGQQVGRGMAVIEGSVEGPNTRGNVAEQIKQQLEAARYQPVDPVSQQRLPRDYEDHTKDYFDSLRSGQQ